ncbi:threonine export protein RhtC [Pantoea septica]|uniref:threonine export protein RhtC n=1 Tax=Pantoea septica TaxID=472695 RepID=UPI0028AC2551|nr:threonine export protein RhtC [Pantoea septica]
MLMLFATVALVHLVALMSPGPDFFFVSQTASRSRKEAMMGVLGITLGIVIWAGVALMGLHLILEKMAWLHQIIMVGGGLYLLWMGWQLLSSARQRHKQPVQDAPVVELPKKGRSFLKGFLTNLSNPKAIIYFGSVFSLFVGNDIGALERWGLFLLIVGETFAWFTLVAAIFALPWMRDKYQRAAKWVDGVAGVLFAGFGIHLIISR